MLNRKSYVMISAYQNKVTGYLEIFYTKNTDIFKIRVCESKVHHFEKSW